jgi:hypothetical protein
MTNHAPEQRISRKLHRMRHDDAREAQRSTLEGLITELRARLNEQFPTRTPAEIEDEIERRLAHGSAPTTAVVPPSPGIPKDVRAARRAERKKQVAAGRHLRR